MPVNPNSKDCVKDEMSRFKAGKLHSGHGKGDKPGPVVKNRKQAVAIALSSCRKSNYTESLQSIGFLQESSQKVARMLDAEDWDNQFDKGTTRKKTGREDKKVKAKGLANLDIDNAPGKQKGNEGKHSQGDARGLPPLAVPSANPQSGPRSLQLKGLRAFSEDPQNGISPQAG